MSASVNKVVLIGNLGGDPDARFTPSGKAVTEFSIATSFKSGENETTEWHSIITWEKTAENCAKYLAKGASVYVEGRLQTRTWDDKDGKKCYKTEVVATEVKFLTPAKQGGGQAKSAPAQAPAVDPFA